MLMTCTKKVLSKLNVFVCVSLALRHW